MKKSGTGCMGLCVCHHRHLSCFHSPKLRVCECDCIIAGKVNLKRFLLCAPPQLVHSRNPARDRAGCHANSRQASEKPFSEPHNSLLNCQASAASVMDHAEDEAAVQASDSLGISHSDLRFQLAFTVALRPPKMSSTCTCWVGDSLKLRTYFPSCWQPNMLFSRPQYRWHSRSWPRKPSQRLTISAGVSPLHAAIPTAA